MLQDDLDRLAALKHHANRMNVMTEVIMQFRQKPITEPERTFLRRLIEWTGAATPREIGPQTTQQDNSVRQSCKRKGWVEFDGYYWRITEAGQDAYSAATMKIMDYQPARRT